MQLLKGKTLDVETVFGPESMSLNLVDAGVSTATMTLGPEAPEIALGRWLRDDTEPGKGIVWRVKSVDTAIETDTRTVQLEHIVATLKDGLIFGEMGSKDSAMAARTAAQNVLAKQSIWTLGTFAFDRSLPYSFNNVTHYAALESICSTLEDSRWEYDLSKLPFRLNIVKKDSGNIGTEMRAGRNLQSIRRTVDMTGMYTRFYPVGARNLHISGDYVQKNTATYGVISRTETDQSIESETMLREWALHRLRRHCEPTVTITIKGLDLSQSTGEALDSLTLGRVCRAPLPEYGTTISQYIIRLSWSDKIRAPEDVTVTLSNHRTDATTNLAQTIKEMHHSSSHNSGGGAKAAEEDHAWIVDTTDKVGLVAESIIGRDPTGKAVDWSRVSEIIVDGEGIHQRVVATEDELVVAEGKIDTNEERILLEVNRAKGEEGKLATRITQTADKVSIIATDKEIDDFIDGGGEGSILSVTRKNITSAVGRIETNEGNIATITGSTLWQNRSSITAAAGKLVVDGNNLRLIDGASLQVKENGVYQTVGTVSYFDSKIAGITGSALWTNRDSITAAAGKLTVSGDKLRLVDGASLEIKENGVYQTVGSVKYIDDKISTITGSTLWQNRNSITAAAGKLVVDGNNLRLIDGASLQVKEDGVYHTVGTVSYFDSKIAGITGSALWQNREGITAAAGKLSVDKDGNLVVKEGAELKVYDDGKNLRSITALAGKVRVNQNGNVVVDGASLYVKDDAGNASDVTAVAGKFTVNDKGNVLLQEGAGLFIQRKSVALRVADRGNVIASINASTEEGVVIQAEKVNLGSYATVKKLDAVSANVDNITNGSTVATMISSKSLNLTSKTGFTFYGDEIRLKAMKFVTKISFKAPSISLTDNKNFMYANTYHGDYSNTTAGCLVKSFAAGGLSYDSETRYVLRRKDDDD